MNNKIRKYIPFFLSLILTGMQIMGFRISMKYQTSVHTVEILKVIYESPLALHLFLGLMEFALIYILLQLLFVILDSRGRDMGKSCSELPLWCWGIVAALLFLCWLPCLAASYPGFFNYDVSGQLSQAMHSGVSYNSHHPLLHTLIVGKIITWGYRLSGQEELTIGILLYSLFQMGFCAAVFTYFIRFLLRMTGRIIIALLALLYYAFFPVIVMYTMSTTKDVMCSGVLLYSMVTLYCLLEDPERFFRSPVRCTGLVLSFAAACLLRKNVIYAVLLLAMVMILFWKGYRCRSILVFGSILAVYVIGSQGMLLALDAQAGGISEAFSVPIQQIARVYHKYGENGFAPGALELMNQVRNAGVWKNYNPLFADPVKNHIDFAPVKAEPGKYLKLWAKTGIRYPKEYIMSFLENTYQAWYPGTSIINEPGSGETCYFDINMSMDMERYSKNSKLLGFYEKLSREHYYQKIPVIRLLFSVGAMFWVALIVFGYGLWRRDRCILYPMVLVLALCLTNLFGPVVLVRYYLILFYGFPVFAGYLLRTRPLAGA